MTNMLYVKVNPKTDEDSQSATLANYFLEKYTSLHADAKVDKLDLYQEKIPFLDVDVFSAWGKFEAQENLSDTEREKVEQMDRLTEQFLQADKIVIAAPFWNLSYPPMLKAYIDTICIKGKTFQYTEKGPVGLVPDKPLLLIETRGGFYSEGPAAQFENSQRYLKTIMQFMGIKSFQSVIAEGLDVNEATRTKELTAAKEQLDTLSKTF